MVGQEGVAVLTLGASRIASNAFGEEEVKPQRGETKQRAEIRDLDDGKNKKAKVALPR